ncbi:protein phosphatase inhibitor 2 [Gregarina niphandrodes]|uniref:Protein phosphatase inhibitor 2 n=1 Tax=Gregarina niphandrodes TaxID=110365 RepID=A0A023B8W3_GRENI|nr:protein phosphatase inhibitor 2 [Gregarina niphandrodes]EZG70560.1 protein phosphatase inhibitor 2 [Gregarina niphandrodes]|eukprot:XP_011129917.1 protein phosphatase inhibitor 2 [Gregarina niphandrodes]
MQTDDTSRRTSQDNQRRTATKGGLKKGDSTKKKSFRWDEESIALQDLERGTRMKIDEPKTPYTGMAPDPVELLEPFSLDGPPPVNNPEQPSPVAQAADAQAAGPQALVSAEFSGEQQSLDFRNALTEAMEQAQKDESEGRSYWDDSTSEAHKKAFEEKRKQHYRMFR